MALRPAKCLPEPVISLLDHVSTSLRHATLPNCHVERSRNISHCSATPTRMTKGFILREIKRTAEANGGKPLGHQSFAKETGIKEYDWKGKIWARWSDAVREAGYSPNSFQTAFDDAFLLGKMAELIHDLGHFPVTM